MPHDHHHHHHNNLKGKKLIFSIVLNILITVVQVVGGIISGSLALLSDALHNFSDAISLIISYIAEKLSRKEFSLKQTYGYKRAEIIAAMINAASLLAIAVVLVQEAIVRMKKPVEIESTWVIFLAAFSIVMNGICVILLKKDAEQSMNIKSAYLHLFTDMMTSVAVLIGGTVIHYYRIYWLDSLLCLLIALYLVASSWKLLIQTLKVLMQFAPPQIDLSELEKKVLEFAQIDNIHHVHIWQLTDEEIHLEAHIDFKEDLVLSKVSEVISKLQQSLQEKFSIGHVVLQPEIGVRDSKKIIVDER